MVYKYIDQLECSREEGGGGGGGELSVAGRSG